MPLICYEPYKPGKLYLDLIDQAKLILDEYDKMGYNLTLRQIYYQFVSRDILPQKWADKITGSTNNMKSYKNLGTLIAKARIGGLLDWYSIEDRTRYLRGLIRYKNGADALQEVADDFHMDWWGGQSYRAEAWVEKEALVDVVAQAANEKDCSYFACKGYVSLSEMWVAAQRLARIAANGQIPVILHLGDHDPSGVDMSRDIEDRLRMFMNEDAYDYTGLGSKLVFERIALNMDQIKALSPPPNPAKITDSRAAAYIDKYGSDSWELDAIPPQDLNTIILDAIDSYIDDEDAWNDAQEEEENQRERILEVAKEW